MKFNRLEAMENELKLQHSITNQQLCKMFNISLQTLRRDLEVLREKGVITKVYGGVIYNHEELTSAIPSLSFRSSSKEKEKIHIGELAAALVEENDVIFIDSGTTAYQMIPFLKRLNHVTIITHSLHVINSSTELKNVTCISLGGQLNLDTYSFQSEPLNVPYNYHKAFISTVGIDVDGCTNTNLIEGGIKQKAMQKSNKTYLVADNTKFSTRGFNRFATLDKFDAIISDQALPEKFDKIINKNKIKILY